MSKWLDTEELRKYLIDYLGTHGGAAYGDMLFVWNADSEELIVVAKRLHLDISRFYQD